MRVRIEPYTPGREPAVSAFNLRLEPQRTALPFRFPERHISDWLPPVPGRRIFSERFLAIEGDAVRGGFILKTQDVMVDDRIRTVGNLQLPLSEGIVNSSYSFVGVQLVLSALRRQPLLYSLGMGGLETPYPKLLKGLGWSLCPVPFFFRVRRPSRFLRQIPRLRGTRTRRLASDLLAFSGAGWVGLRAAQALMGARARRRPGLGCRTEVVGRYDAWTDEIWAAAKASYPFVAVRDRATLDALYGGDYFPGVIVLKMTRDSRPIGWTAVLDTPMRDHRHFGGLQVGSIADGFAAPADACAVLAAATSFLEDRGVDLIVSNQLHHAWVHGLRAAGYLEGPSNFALALSKQLDALVRSCAPRSSDWFFDRGDGDGPINL